MTDLERVEDRVEHKWPAFSCACMICLCAMVAMNGDEYVGEVLTIIVIQLLIPSETY